MGLLGKYKLSGGADVLARDNLSDDFNAIQIVFIKFDYMLFTL